MLFFYSFCGNAQINDAIYDSIYPISDCIKKEKKTGLFSHNIYKTLDSLNVLHPKHYFYKAIQLANQTKFNDASLLYITGCIRYKYYNWCKRTKNVSEDEKLMIHFKETIGEMAFMFLRSDVDNFISILNSSVSYCKDNDYIYFNKAKNIDSYTESYSFYQRMSKGFMFDKEYFRKMWQWERKEYEENSK